MWLGFTVLEPGRSPNPSQPCDWLNVSTPPVKPPVKVNWREMDSWGSKEKSVQVGLLRMRVGLQRAALSHRVGAMLTY